jgi:hypothetical protein
MTYIHTYWYVRTYVHVYARTYVPIATCSYRQVCRLCSACSSQAAARSSSSSSSGGGGGGGSSSSGGNSSSSSSSGGGGGNSSSSSSSSSNSSTSTAAAAQQVPIRTIIICGARVPALPLARRRVAARAIPFKLLLRRRHLPRRSFSPFSDRTNGSRNEPVLANGRGRGGGAGEES